MPTRWTLPAIAGLGLLLVLGCYPESTTALLPAEAAAPQGASQGEPQPRRMVRAPELDGGVAWLNTAGPIHLKDLRGKIVVLDFWTFCCINCIHTLPDLKKLEQKYPNELVVIGVHSAKFTQERDTDAIRKAILRYEISHPVVNDAKHVLWDRYAVESWPSLFLIDPEGFVVGRGSGEGLYEPLDGAIQKLIKIHKEKKTLNEKPMKFELARYSETGESPLFFPGKVLADEASKRLFIADSTHHRIVITDLDGKKIDIAGTGTPGLKDGSFAEAQFDDPQGLSLDGETLYVADRKNHSIRALDLKNKTVRRIAGTGEQGRNREGGGKGPETALNSPWDLLVNKGELYIAMAGSHQIWIMDLKSGEIQPWAGLGGENIRDGERREALFSQPSGLATDGRSLFVADSEVSAIRSIGLNPGGEVKTLVGRGLFVFGDVDGKGDRVRLQHAVGVTAHDGVLYIADTYNNKIKVLDPKTLGCATWLGGNEPGWLTSSVFHEPTGLSIAGGKMYVADTNAHRIRVVDLKTKAVSTLKLQGVEAPKQPESPK